MNTDAKIKEDVLDELDWEPSIDATKIGVSVHNGIVTLSGQVGTHAEKLSAEKAAKRVYGVKAVVEDIEVRVVGSNKRTDLDIAEAALNSLQWNTNVPDKKIRLKVEDGWITLEGEVNWFYQKEAARNAIRNLAGVKGVVNLIDVKPAIETRGIKDMIRSAFERSATVEANNVDVRVDGHKVFLEGTVQSLAEKRQAEKAVWSAPGVWSVENNLRISVPEHAYSS